MYKLTLYLETSVIEAFGQDRPADGQELRSDIKETPSAYMNDDLYTTSFRVFVFSFIYKPPTYVTMTEPHLIQPYFFLLCHVKTMPLGGSG